jgi:UDP-N-acetylglucosamine 2-epimerase
VTVSMGTNRVVGCDPHGLLDSALELFENRFQGRFSPEHPPLWDGQTAPRIVHILKQAWQRRLAGAEEPVPL